MQKAEGYGQTLAKRVLTLVGVLARMNYFIMNQYQSGDTDKVHINLNCFQFIIVVRIKSFPIKIPPIFNTPEGFFIYQNVRSNIAI